MDTDDALMRTCNDQNCPAMNGGPKWGYFSKNILYIVVQPWPKLSHHEQMYNYLLIVLRQVQISPIFFPPPGTNISGRMGIKSRKSSQRQSELSQKFTKDGKCHNFLSQNFDQWQKISPLANNVNDFVTGIRYVIRLMEWIDDMITDEKIFPPVDDIPFPRYLMFHKCAHIMEHPNMFRKCAHGTFKADIVCF